MSSATSLLRLETVAKMAGISEPTLRIWLQVEFVRASAYVEGKRPLFTQADAHAVVQFAEKRRQQAQAMRLPKVPA